MAAGLTIHQANVQHFHQAFEQVVSTLLMPADLQRILPTDGTLEVQDMHWDMACAIERQVWGQGFSPPIFCDEFQVKSQRIVGEKHLKLTLEKQGALVEAIFFQQQSPLPVNIRAVYQLQTNSYNGAKNIQLNLQHWEDIESAKSK